jgi:hypothetical protein
VRDISIPHAIDRERPMLEPARRRRRITGVRYWLPLAAAFVLLYVATMASAIVGLVLIIAAFGLVIEVSTKLFENAGKTGGLHNHRQ